MTHQQVLRHVDADELVALTAERLLDRLVELQVDGRIAQVCLSGGRIALRIYSQVARLIEGSALDPGRMELWWSDERFAPTDDPERHAGPTLAVLAGRFPLDPARTHPMPAADGVADPDASAATYAKELGDTVFDICLLGVGPHGHVAGIFPDHPSFEARSQEVIGVNDSPKAVSQRISLTIPRLSRSREVWFLVSGADKADAVVRGWAGDPTIPAGVVRGTEQTRWFVDRDAAADLPWFECSL